MTGTDTDTVRRFLAPASIAIIGASQDQTTPSGRPLLILQQHRFSGPIYPVNPRYTSLGGLTCYASVREIPGDVELALVCVPAALVPDVIEECQDAGIPAAYIITSGFSEAPGDTAGAAVAARLREALSRTGTRVSGPNAEGIYNLIDDIALGFSPTVDYSRGLKSRPRPGSAAIVAQSGGIGFGIMNQGLARGIDFSYVISTGNESDLGVLEYVEYLIADERTKVIGLFLEGLEEPLRLRDLGFAAAEAGKAIVVVKIGRSAEAQEAALSHTGHLAGPGLLWSALFRQAGIIEVTDIAEFLDVLSVLARFQAASGRRAAMVTVSGGAGAWMADVLRQFDLDVPQLSREIQDELRPLLPYYAGTRNPVDITANVAGNAEIIDRVMALVGGSGQVDIVVAITSLMNAERGIESAGHYGKLARSLGKPLIIYSYTQPADGVTDAFAEQGLPVVLSQAGVGRAASVLAELPNRRATAAQSEGGPVAAALPGSGDATLHEAEVKAWLRQCGLPVLTGRLVQSAAEAVAAGRALGYPVALKVQAAALPHKSEKGVMALGLSTDPEVEAAYERICGRAGALIGAGNVAGVLVETMASAGFEMLIGITRDRSLGAFLTVGQGGSQAEVYGDVQVLPAPASAAEVEAALARLRCAKVFAKAADGGLDVAAFCALAAEVSRIAAATTDLAELDLNPVIVHSPGEGADIADALAVRRR